MRKKKQPEHKGFVCRYKNTSVEGLAPHIVAMNRAVNAFMKASREIADEEVELETLRLQLAVKKFFKKL